MTSLKRWIFLFTAYFKTPKITLAAVYIFLNNINIFFLNSKNQKQRNFSSVHGHPSGFALLAVPLAFCGVI